MTPFVFEIFGYILICAGAGGISLLIARQLGTISLIKKARQIAVRDFQSQLEGQREYRTLTRAQPLPASWSGTRKFRIHKKQVEGGDICSFYLVPHDEKTPLPAFRPGQYLTFHIESGGRKHMRCYSLSDCHHADHYRVSIKKMVPKDRHYSISTHFHDKLQEGDVVDVAAPAGDFVLDPAGSGPVVLSGAGVGVTPVLSMMNALLAAGTRREVWFFYGVINGSHHILRSQVRQWRSLGLPNIHIVVCFSDPVEGMDEQGRDYDEKSRVDPALMRRLLPSSKFQFYTCGPPPMMNGLRSGLKEWGVPEEHIHDEAFVQMTQAVSLNASSITFLRSNLQLQISGPATSLLDFAHAENVELPSGCKAGHCGACQTRLDKGNVRYSMPPKFQVQPGCCLPCICLPEGDIVLDA